MREQHGRRAARQQRAAEANQALASHSSRPSIYVSEGSALVFAVGSMRVVALTCGLAPVSTHFSFVNTFSLASGPLVVAQLALAATAVTVELSPADTASAVDTGTSAVDTALLEIEDTDVHAA